MATDPKRSSFTAAIFVISSALWSVMVCPILLFSCSDDPVGSGIPEIALQGVAKYKNRAGSDSMLVLTLDYRDGNGDLGLSDQDTMPPFNFGNRAFYNLFIEYQVKNSGSWSHILNPVSKDTIQFNQRFPRLNNSKNTRPVSGTMDVRIPAEPYPGIRPDTVRFRCRMMDRGMNLSNLVQSEDVLLKH